MTGPEAPVVLLVTTNGAGMGHLARQTAIAQSATGMRPLLVSMSTGLPAVCAATGLPGEYIPGYTRGWLPRAGWDAYLRDRLLALAEASGAAAIAFDGVHPYRGLTAVARARRDLPMVWLRRGLWRPGTNERALRACRYFDRIIEPGDIAAAADRGATAGRGDALRVAPVTLLSTVPALTREESARELGLDPDRPTLLLTLGAGNINDTAGPLAAAVRGARGAGDWQVVMTSAPISSEGAPPPGVQVLRRVFPLVRHRHAFDAVVAAAGYNAVHEFVLGGVPTLLVPNPSAATDDQVARAECLARAGRALVADELDPAQVERQTRALLEPDTLARLRGAAPPGPIDGAAEAAAAIAEVIGHPGRRPAVDLAAARVGALRAARGVVGDRRYAALAGRLGRPELDLRPRAVRVVGGGEPATGAIEGSGGADGPLTLVITTDLGAVGPAPRPVVEHLGLADPGYASARAALVHRHYEVRP